MSYTKEFKQLYKRIERTYLGKPVPTTLMKDFGKKYNKKDILPLTIRKAKIRGIQIE